MALVDQPSIVTAGVGSIVIPSDAGETSSLTYTLFTVPLGEPARVDTVYMQAVTEIALTNTTFELLLVDASGVVLHREATPTLIGGSPNVDTVQISWAIGSTGSNQQSPPLPLTSPTGSGLLIFSLPLPPLVLKALSTVQVTVARESDGGLPSVVLSDIAIAYTPGGGDTTTSEVVLNVQPILVAGPS